MFQCIKDVPKSEISEAYEIKTKAFFKGIKCSLIWDIKDNKINVGIECGHSEEGIARKNMLIELGFKESMPERFFTIYKGYVSLDDPEFEMYEERTELDIDEL